jgi:hypothetical protein
MDLLVVVWPHASISTASTAVTPEWIRLPPIGGRCPVISVIPCPSNLRNSISGEESEVGRYAVGKFERLAPLSVGVIGLLLECSALAPLPLIFFAALGGSDQWKDPSIRRMTYWLPE